MLLVTISCNTAKHAEATLREVKSMLVFAAGETGEGSAAFPHTSKTGAVGGFCFALTCHD